MEVETAAEMGPERVLPSSEDDLGEERPSDGAAPGAGGEWSGEDMAEDDGEGDMEEDDGVNDNGGYYYQPLNQEPDGQNGMPAEQAEETGSHAEQLQEVQERIEAMGLYLPQAPPPDSDEEEDPDAAAAERSHASIPMDPDHVELVKRTMASVALPSLGIPPWAQDLSDDQWRDMVQHTLENRQSAAGLRVLRKTARN
ncbi:male-enhanced antigen 1 [Lampris incognitus]|uniref:male-enhanced antigen 1 n=1 Tax=Lampris incognitus TaxID=2546036 RepID=UPI0024B5F56B|nr:male-enhanced antigen 1 [Lampris incognitus]